MPILYYIIRTLYRIDHRYSMLIQLVYPPLTPKHSAIYYTERYGYEL